MVARVKNNLVLEAKLKDIGRMEDFICSIPEFTSFEKNKVLLVSNEIFENIIQHSKNIPDGIRVRIHKGGKISLLFVFQSLNFDMYLTKFKPQKPYFDTCQNRYRGIGLRICYSISQSIHYRVTSRYTAVLIRI